MDFISIAMLLSAMLSFISLLYFYFKIEEERQNKKRKFGAEDLKLNYLEILKRVDVMTGEQFQQFFIFILNTIGYDAYPTRTTRDYGADAIIEINSVKFVAQLKRYSKKVGLAAVQEVLGAINFYHANQGIVVTNNRFSSPAHKLASCNDILLWDRSKLIELIQEAQNKSRFY